MRSLFSIQLLFLSVSAQCRKRRRRSDVLDDVMRIGKVIYNVIMLQSKTMKRSRAFAPPPEVRILMAGYIYLLDHCVSLINQNHHHDVAWKDTEPWLLHIFVVNVLLVLLPSLSLDSVNIEQCLVYLEYTLQYFGAIQLISYFLWNYSEDVIILNTMGILYMAWHLWKALPPSLGYNTSGMMKATLFLQCFVMLPFFWSTRPFFGSSKGLGLLMQSSILCDAAFVLLDYVLLSLYQALIMSL